MILDTSALLAILLNEPERPSFVLRISRADQVLVSSPSLLEAGLVLTSRGSSDAIERLQGLLSVIDARTVEFGSEHWREAIAAFARFGKGRHPAGLNFGDCISYATARVAHQPLLAKGDDFPLTDIELA